MIEEPEWAPSRPRWLQLYAILRKRIEQGVYRPEYPIPSLTQLQQEFGLAEGTIIKAIGRLKRERLVESHQGFGTVVLDPEMWLPPEAE